MKSSAIFPVIAVRLAISSWQPIYAQTFDLQGRVTDSASGQPISGAKIVLLAAGINDTSDAMGDFHLQAVRVPILSPSHEMDTKLQLHDGKLDFRIDSPRSLTLRIFNAGGHLLADYFQKRVQMGHYTASYIPSERGWYVYQMELGEKRSSFPFLFMNSRDGYHALTVQNKATGNWVLSRIGAFADTLLASKAGYQSAKAPISSAVQSGISIKMAKMEGLLTQERPTPEQLGLYFVPPQAVDSLTTVSLNYRKTGSVEWNLAHPLIRINPNWVTSGAPKAPVASYAGSIFDLQPATWYEVQVTVSEPGKPELKYVNAFQTRPLPSAAPATTVNATTSDNLQSKLNALVPGDVLEIANGTYEVNTLHFNAAGTKEKPIYVRGASRKGVIIKDTSGTVLQLQMAAHVVFENFTLQGSGIDDGTNASSTGVSFWSGSESQEYVTFRNLDIVGVDMGIIGWNAIRSVLVYNCSLKGNNTWTKSEIETNQTWNDDGIRLPGEGNCAFQNTLYGFGDAFAVNDGAFSAAVYFYRNLVTMTGDDGFEADYATRNIGFYDNHLTNSSTFLSLDPIWGGPLYCFRNISINTVRGPFKLNSTNSGFLIYNNTLVRTDGTTGWGWVQYNNGSLRNWSYRNNAFIYRGTGNLLAIESTGNSPIDLTNNAWYPDKAVWWSNTGGSFQNLAAARSGLSATSPVVGGSTHRHDHDVITTSNPFTTDIAIGDTHLTEITTTYVPIPAPGTTLKNAGIAIPGVTDGYSGANPDIGAVIEGRPVPPWGSP